MVLQNDMPLSGVITMSLKGEERGLHERDLLSYVENLSRGGKEALQQALKEVETAIAGWDDSYFISTYEKRVDEFKQGKLNSDEYYLEDLFFKEDLLIKEGKVGLTVDYLENPLKVVPLIHSNLTPVKFSHSPFCLFLFSSYSSCPLCRVLH